MRSGHFIILAALTSAFCHATTLLDTFNQPQNTCSYSGTAPWGTCDVIGDPQLFDIQAASYTVGSGVATMMIYVNSGAVNSSMKLGSFVDGGTTLIPGDIFFYDPSDPATAQYLKYGLALTNHGTFIAGDLYAIAGGVTTETALQALNDNSSYYRRDEPVLMTGSGTPLVAGSVNVSNYGDGTNNARYAITISIPTTSALPTLLSGGQMGILFSSADCGNDVIQGTVTGTQAPEPSPAILLLSGIGLLIAGTKWRKRAA